MSTALNICMTMTVALNMPQNARMPRPPVSCKEPSHLHASHNRHAPPHLPSEVKVTGGQGHSALWA